MTLEEIVDASTLGKVIQALSHLCWEKAQHIEENWQDESLAKAWRDAAKKIECIKTDGI
jgi:hypothetical protein